MKKSTKLLILASVLTLPIAFTGCSKLNKSKSSTTGWNYNDSKNGGFQKVPYKNDKIGPGLVPIEGGTFVMGSIEQDLAYENNNSERRVTVTSFYMDETEVANIDWLEYLYWLGRVYKNNPQVYQQALPDTLVWRNPLAYNEPYVDNYLRHPAFQDYPVVGVSWDQAQAYCIWRTDRANEQILISKGIMKPNTNQAGADNFTTDSYYAGQYEGLVGKGVKNLDPGAANKTRPVRMSDGIMLPGEYRLPTEAEWEYAALSLKGNVKYENIQERKIYPWNGLTQRSAHGKTQGLFLANFKRGKGDNSGVAGYLNDDADITAPVKSYLPNDFGLYNMAGNVNEWVQDVYRPLSFEDVSDLNPFRGNEFKIKAKEKNGNYVKKDSLGRIPRIPDTVKITVDGKHIVKKDDVRGQDDPMEMYGYPATSLITNKSRVYKGGSWNDRAYWLTPGSRRFLAQDSASAEIGFRCAMGRVGPPSIGKTKNKPSFKSK
ncbi:SUMF1/EgtB/PvdO family nonheme iron enzyme [Solitalea koreensis]